MGKAARRVGSVIAAVLLARAALGQEVAAVRVASGLIRPVYATSPPGETERLFVVERLFPAQIRIIDLATGEVDPEPFLRLTGVVLEGLLGLAFHPDYAVNRRFYVHYIADPADEFGITGYSTIAEYRARPDDPARADPESERIVLTFAQPTPDHNGGWLDFGPDGYLYVSSGDGGRVCDNGAGHTPGIGNAQDLGTLLGKLLRIDVDGDDFPNNPNRNYAIPPDNPFVGATGAAEEIFAYGLRNPWRASFDRATGDLYIGEVGHETLEEVNFLPASSPGGENYGWRLREGTRATPPCENGEVGGPAPPGAVQPLYQYSHGSGPTQGRSLIGGYVYRGPFLGLWGHYFFGDFLAEQIWSFRFDGSDPGEFDGTNVSDFSIRTEELTPDVGSLGSIVSFGEDGVGNLYVVDNGAVGGATGEIYRIVERARPPSPPVAFYGAARAPGGEDGSALYRVDPDTGHATLVGRIEGSVCGDGRHSGVAIAALAFVAGGRLVGVTDGDVCARGTAGLFEIDPVTAGATFIGLIDLGVGLTGPGSCLGIADLTYDPVADALYGIATGCPTEIGSRDRLFAIDPDTGLGAPVSAIPIDSETRLESGLSRDPRTGALFAARRSLERIDPADGTAEVEIPLDAGVLPGASGIDTLAFVPGAERGALFGTLRMERRDPKGSALANVLVTVDTATGAVAGVGETTRGMNALAAQRVTGCSSAPIGSCRGGRRSELQIRGDALAWSLRGGDATSRSQLGHPLDDTDYRLCVYQQPSTALPALALETKVLPGAGWSETRRGIRYTNRDETRGGIQKLRLHAGRRGKARLDVKARIAGPLDRPLDDKESIVVQLLSGDGECWGAVFDGKPLRNDAHEFRAQLR